MRQRSRGWIMPEADIASLLRLIEERVRSPEIEVPHRDALIRLRSILEHDLNPDGLDDASKERSLGQEAAA